jgi:hypothetical protein
MLMNDFAHPLAQLSAVTYTSADDTYTVYGWTVAMHRTAMEFSTLANADRRGFSILGSGSAVVTTPPDYIAGRSYRVIMRGDTVASTAEVTADAAGRLHVPLGPANRS